MVVVVVVIAAVAAAVVVTVVVVVVLVVERPRILNGSDLKQLKRQFPFHRVSNRE